MRIHLAIRAFPPGSQVRTLDRVEMARPSPMAALCLLSFGTAIWPVIRFDGLQPNGTGESEKDGDRGLLPSGTGACMDPAHAQAGEACRRRTADPLTGTEERWR